jgi:virulence-associated protein VapD
MRKKACRKAINFDLDTNVLLTVFPNTGTPYSAIKRNMLKLGFEHRQYSGYTSIEKMTEYDVTLAMQQLYKKLPWLSTFGLIKKIDVTDIGKQYELSNLFEKSPDVEKSVPNTNTPPGQSTLSMKDIAQATEEHGEKSAPGRDTLDVDERV